MATCSNASVPPLSPPGGNELPDILRDAYARQIADAKRECDFARALHLANIVEQRFGAEAKAAMLAQVAQS